MIDAGEKRENAKRAGMPVLLAGRFRWSTAVQRLRETNRRASRGMGAEHFNDDPPPTALWGEDDKV